VDFDTEKAKLNSPGKFPLLLSNRGDNNICHMHTALFMHDLKTNAYQKALITYLKKTKTTPGNIITSM